MNTKFKIAQAKVYADFFTGISIAWFSGGIIAPFLSQSYSKNNLILGLYSLIVTYVFISYAIIFSERSKNGN